MEDAVNPFRPGGHLEQEADAMLRRSTIERNSVLICDPGAVGEPPMAPSFVGVQQLTPDRAGRGVHFSPQGGADTTSTPFAHKTGDERMQVPPPPPPLFNCSKVDAELSAVPQVTTAGSAPPAAQPMFAQTVSLASPKDAKQRRRCCCTLQ